MWRGFQSKKMGKTVNLHGTEFTPAKDLEKRQKQANKRVQQVVNALKRAEESLIAIWLTENGKQTNARQFKKVIKSVQPWEEAKKEGFIYQSFFMYHNQGTKQHDKMFKIGVKQHDGGYEIAFETPEAENNFTKRATEALKKIKF